MKSLTRQTAEASPSTNPSIGRSLAVSLVTRYAFIIARVSPSLTDSQWMLRDKPATVTLTHAAAPEGRIVIGPAPPTPAVTTATGIEACCETARFQLARISTTRAVRYIEAVSVWIQTCNSRHVQPEPQRNFVIYLSPSTIRISTTIPTLTPAVIGAAKKNGTWLGGMTRYGCTLFGGSGSTRLL
jgi:hypothetical protein